MLQDPKLSKKVDEQIANKVAEVQQLHKQELKAAETKAAAKLSLKERVALAMKTKSGDNQADHDLDGKGPRRENTAEEHEANNDSNGAGADDGVDKKDTKKKKKDKRKADHAEMYVARSVCSGVCVSGS